MPKKVQKFVCRKKDEGKKQRLWGEKKLNNTLILNIFSANIMDRCGRLKI
jgi:hypothetical protein